MLFKMRTSQTHLKSNTEVFVWCSFFCRLYHPFRLFFPPCNTELFQPCLKSFYSVIKPTFFLHKLSQTLFKHFLSALFVREQCVDEKPHLLLPVSLKCSTTFLLPNFLFECLVCSAALEDCVSISLRSISELCHCLMLISLKKILWYSINFYWRLSLKNLSILSLVSRMFCLLEGVFLFPSAGF